MFFTCWVHHLYLIHFAIINIAKIIRNMMLGQEFYMQKMMIIQLHILGDDYLKRMPRVTEGVARLRTLTAQWS